MKIKELTFAEAIEAAESGYRIAYDYTTDQEEYRVTNNGHLWTSSDYDAYMRGDRDVRPCLTAELVTRFKTPRWKIIADPMSFQEACRFSRDTGMTMRRKQGTARLSISATGEIDCTVVGGNSAIVHRLTMDDLKATDWTPDIDSVKVNERAITPQQLKG